MYIKSLEDLKVELDSMSEHINTKINYIKSIINDNNKINDCFIKNYQDLQNKVKNYEYTIIEKDKKVQTLMDQLKLDKVYSVKNMKCFALINIDGNGTFKTKDMSVNEIAKTYGVDSSWLTKKLKSGNGVAIIKNIQFVLVRI